jgi:hypothetical protein
LLPARVFWSLTPITRTFARASWENNSNSGHVSTVACILHGKWQQGTQLHHETTEWIFFWVEWRWKCCEVTSREIEAVGTWTQNTAPFSTLLNFSLLHSKILKFLESKRCAHIYGVITE